MAFQDAHVREMLADNSYHIEFHGYLTNHRKHAVIALRGLGAEAGFIQNYVDDYAKNTYGFGLEEPKPSPAVVTDENWREMFGRHQNFNSMVHYVTSRSKEVGVDAVLKQLVPELIAGGIGSLVHGMIHLGWAIHAKHEKMIIEGIAYLAFSFVDCHPERMSGRYEDISPVDSLLRLAGEWTNHPELGQWVDGVVAAEPMPSLQVLEGTGAQLKISQVLDAGHPLLDSELAWFSSTSIPSLWSQLEYAVGLLFAAKPGDFVVLHLVTGLFGMEQIVSKLNDDDARKAARCFWKSAIAVLMALKAFPEEKELSSVHDKYEGMKDDPENADVAADWKDMYDRALADKEEHNAKLVYVMKNWWVKSEYKSLFREAATHFTTTPIIT